MPTTVNAVLRNIDAVDCAATNISCTNLTVGGQPVSTSIQNMAGSTAGNTVFNGKLVANNIQSLDKLEGFNTQTFDLTVANEANINKLTAGTLAFTSATVSGNLTADNIDTTEIRANTLRADAAVIRQIDGIDMNLSAGNLANSGVLTQTGDATFRNITQESGTTSLKATTCTSLEAPDVTSNGKSLTATVQNMNATPDWTIVNGTFEGDDLRFTSVTAAGLTVNGDATITGTLTPGTLSITNLTVGGTLTQTGAATFSTNITQSAGTAALKAVTATSISNSGTLTQTGDATFSGVCNVSTAPRLTYTSTPTMTTGSIGYTTVQYATVSASTLTLTTSAVSYMTSSITTGAWNIIFYALVTLNANNTANSIIADLYVNSVLVRSFVTVVPATSTSTTTTTINGFHYYTNYTTSTYTVDVRLRTTYSVTTLIASASTTSNKASTIICQRIA